MLNLKISPHYYLPGFLHDECSAIHPMGLLSPFFRRLPLSQHGLEWLPFPASVAHPLDDGPAPMLYRSLDRTAERLGTDGKSWRSLLAPFLAHPHDLLEDLMGPLKPLPRRPLLMARFGWYGMRSATRLAERWFEAPQAAALLAGCAAAHAGPRHAGGAAFPGTVDPHRPSLSPRMNTNSHRYWPI